MSETSINQDISSMIEQNLILHWMYLKNTKDSEYIDTTNLQYISASPYNRVLYVDYQEWEGFEQFAEQKGEPLKWIIGPSTKPSDLGEILVRNGFNYLDTWAGMATKLTSNTLNIPKRVGFEFRKVANQADLLSWINVYVDGYKRPDSDKVKLFNRFETIINHKAYQLYIGLYENKPAVVGTVFFDKNIVGLYCITTAPDMRRKGLATIYLQNLLSIVHQQGATDCVLHATDEGKPTYEKLGFKLYNSFKVYQVSS